MNEDDWNRFVRVIRADGSERTMPMAAWSEDLARRVLANGGRFVLPKEPGEQRVVGRPLPRPPSQRDEDLDLVKELLDVERGLAPWEVEFAESVSRWLDSHDTLTEKQRAKAEQIARMRGM